MIDYQMENAKLIMHRRVELGLHEFSRPFWGDLPEIEELLKILKEISEIDELEKIHYLARKGMELEWRLV